MLCSPWLTSWFPGRKSGAVSRAYYAAIHVARLLLGQCGFGVPRGDQAHAYLWLRLSNGQHPDLANAHGCAIGVEHTIRSLDLARDKEGRSGIKPRTGEAGDRVRAAGAGGEQGKTEMVGRLRIVLGADGARLFMEIADGNDRGASQSFVEMHRAAADDKEGVLDALIGEKLYDVIGKFHYRYLW